MSRICENPFEAEDRNPAAALATDRRRESLVGGRCSACAAGYSRGDSVVMIAFDRKAAVTICEPCWEGMDRYCRPSPDLHPHAWWHVGAFSKSRG